MSKETKTRVANAFRAMKGIGISEDKVKPVLRYLLKLYDKNWELIEEENYRALADAIFEREEAEAEERSKKIADNAAAEHPKKIANNEKEDYLEEEAQANEEPERPLKRLRLKYRDGQSSSGATHSSVSKMLLVRPKEEPEELPQTCPPMLNVSQGTMESPQPNAENTSVNAQSVPCQSRGKRKGKQPISPSSLIAHEGDESCQPSGIGRNQQNITEPRSPSPHAMSLRDRGKRSVSPQILSREKRLVPLSASNPVLHEEPTVAPGVVLPSQEKSIASHSVIIPKDEPVTDDMPLVEVPIAVIYPGPSNGGDSSCMNGTIRDHEILEPSISLYVNEKEGASGAASPNGPRNNGHLAMGSGQCSSNLEIASSPFGEVKISLSYDTALGRPDFRMPTLETLLNSVEENYLRSYKTADPNFSVMNLMKEICLGLVNLGSDSNSEAPETLNVTRTVDLLNESSATDELGDRGLCVTLSGSVDSQFDAEATLPKTPLLLPSCSGVDDDSLLKKIDGGDEGGPHIENRENCPENMNDLSLVVASQVVASEIASSLHDAVDIAEGQEKVVITLANEVNNESPPSFHYIPQNVVFRNAYVNFSLAYIGDNNCCSTCYGDCLLPSTTPCACSQKTSGEFAYTTDGLLKEKILEECISMSRDPKKHCQSFCKECSLERSKREYIIEPCKGHLMRKFIKECWWKCGCNKQCGNRVVQRGITRKLQVFMTPEGKGWGVRTLEDLPKGSFVCEYVGELLTNAELFGRVFKRPKGEKHSYNVLLDAGWVAGGELKDEEALCLDATYYGNVARFINHRCYDSNLVEIPVEVDTPDHHYYHLAFFTTREVKAMEELTWDYGIDFEDHDHPTKVFSCHCGSKFCRNIRRSRSRTGRR